MPRYLLALYKADDDQRPEEQTRQVWADLDVLYERMTAAGAFVFQGGLLPAQSATVVGQSGGDFLITDGPYAETKEHLAGFWIIDVPDLETALEWAKLTTVAQQRRIEVRPFFDGSLDDAIRTMRPAR
jgi:hypothetical protein